MTASPYTAASPVIGPEPPRTNGLELVEAAAAVAAEADSAAAVSEAAAVEDDVLEELPQAAKDAAIATASPPLKNFSNFIIPSLVFYLLKKMFLL